MFYKSLIVNLLRIVFFSLRRSTRFSTMIGPILYEQDTDSF